MKLVSQFAMTKLDMDTRGNPWKGGLDRHLAGFGRRFVAYFVDVIPITALVAMAFYYGTSFGDLWDARMGAAAGSDTGAEGRAEFLKMRNMVRDVSMVVYVIYSGVMEATSWSGTLGKRLLGIRVLSEKGERLSLVKAMQRNIFKLLSAAILCLGFLWVLFSKKNQGWHDSLAHTLVVRVVPKSRTGKYASHGRPGGGAAPPIV